MTVDTDLNHTSTDSHGTVTSHRTLHDYSNNTRMRIFNLLNFKEMPDKFQTCHGGKQLDCSSFH